jgi:hypothetical protein
LLLVITWAVALAQKGPYLRNGIPADQKRLHTQGKKGRPVTCQKSFEPTCDMYWYVRYWNREFHGEDCYESPLRHPAKDKAPWSERKFVVFQPDIGGWNNIRMGAETAIVFAHATGRTLVMPPMMKFYLLDRNADQEENKSSFQKFFDFKKISEAVDIVSMDEFIEHVAKKNLLKAPLPNNLSTKQGDTWNYMTTDLWKYMHVACHNITYSWGENFIGFNISRAENGKPVIGPVEPSKYNRRYREMVIRRRTVVPYDEQMDSHRALFLPGDGPARMLTHFYAFLYWADTHTEQIYMRIVRDRLHYHDDIFCSAGKIVKLIHQDAAKVTHKPAPVLDHAHFKTLGGDTNQDATYFAYHIRRGDFQYEETQIPAEEIWENTKHLLNPNISTLIYIATDESNRYVSAVCWLVLIVRLWHTGTQYFQGTPRSNIEYLCFSTPVLLCYALSTVNSPALLVQDLFRAHDATSLHRALPGQLPRSKPAQGQGQAQFEPRRHDGAGGMRQRAHVHRYTVLNVYRLYHQNARYVS